MDAPRIGPTLLLVVLSAACGALLVEVLRKPSVESGSEIVREQRAKLEDLQAELVRLRSERASAVTPVLESPVLESTEASSPALAGRAPSTPGSARPASEEAEPTTGASAGKPASEGRPATRGGMCDLIRALTASDARQTSTALVDDAERVAELSAVRKDGPTVRAEETTPSADVEDGTTIVLDAGVYDFSAFSSAHRGAFPADVTFRGVGMDRTLLILNEVGATGETRNLGFEDLTLDTRGHYLADVRGDEPISLRFERARVIGFDQAPGGAVLLAARSGAVVAVDTRFEAGFGNAPGTGSFFHVRGPFLVRLEGCTLVGPFKSLYEKSDRAAYVFVRCRFEGMRPERRRDLETPDANVRFEDCQVEYDPHADETPTPRSRSELNPAWT